MLNSIHFQELSIHFKKHQKAALTFRTSCTVCGKDNLSEDQLLKHLSEDHYKGSTDLDKDYEVPLKLDQVCIETSWTPIYLYPMQVDQVA